MANFVDLPYRDSLRLTTAEVENNTSEPIFKDENLTVYAIQVFASEQQTDNNASGPSSPNLKRKHPNTNENAPSPKRLSISGANSNLHVHRDSPFRLQNEDAQSWRRMVVSRMFPGDGGVCFNANHSIASRHLKKRLPSWSQHQVATSYLALGPEYRGKFNPAIADSLGVPKGRERGLLAKGESISLPDGKVITPDMVLGSSSPAIVGFQF